MTVVTTKPARSELCTDAALPRERLAQLKKVAARYAVAITPAMADLIDPADPHDPIARQFVPDARELETSAEERGDPIGDHAHSPVEGIVHRYPDRVLLTPILHCPVYCRYCFRREVVGGEEAVLGEADLTRALAYIGENRAIWEVILTGGDPLMLPAARIARLIAALTEIGHVRTIRIHSRVPVSDPARIGPALIEALDCDKALWIAVHCNHPRELGEPARSALRRLAKAGIPLLGQSVLLKGVNDDAQTLEALFRAMVECRIKPYYLHHPDLAEGTGHFRPTIAEGQALVRHLRGRLSGLAQPDYVLDIPGGFGKVPIGPSYLEGDGVEDWQGRRHVYPPAPPGPESVEAQARAPRSPGA